MVRNALNFLCAVFASMALVSCGGGGGGDGGNSSTPPVPVVVIATAKVELDPGLPASLASAITQVITPAGSASYGSPVPITRDTQNGQTLVIAVDANGNILAAATGSSTDIRLSATSTATALVRLGMGDLTGVTAGATVDASISAQPTFADFVTSVSNAMARGSPPMGDPIVQQQLSQLVALLAAPAKGVSSARSLAIVEPRLTTPLPATLVPDEVGIFPFSSPVQLTGSASGSVFIANRMMIPWAVSTTNVSGAPLQATAVLIGARATGEVAGSPPGFSILVAQNEATQREINADLIVRAMKTALAFTKAASCSDEALKTAVKSILSTAPAPLTGDTLVSAIQDFFTPTNMTRLGSSCAPAGTLSDILKPIAKLIGVWAQAKRAYDAVSLTANAAYAYVYSGSSWEYGVCESATSEVISCAVEYKLTPSPLYMAPQASVPTTLTAKDVRGDLTLPSGDLIASTSNVATIDPKTYLVTANSVGSVTLTLTDQATNEMAELPVTVVIPQVSPATATVAPGQSFTLRMTDSQGRLVETPPGTTWSVSGPNASNVRALSLLNSNIATWIVDSNSPAGSITVTANAPDGFAYSATSKAEITIKTVTEIWVKYALNMEETPNSIGPGGILPAYLANVGGYSVRVVAPFSGGLGGVPQTPESFIVASPSYSIFDSAGLNYYSYSPFSTAYPTPFLYFTYSATVSDVSLTRPTEAPPTVITVTRTNFSIQHTQFGPMGEILPVPVFSRVLSQTDFTLRYLPYVWRLERIVPAT